MTLRSFAVGAGLALSLIATAAFAGPAVYAPRFAEPTKMPKLTTEIVDFDPLGADYAAVVGRFHLTLEDGKDATGLFSLVFHKTAQGWRIVSDHSS
jgi:ketosteroid isomerase-like protein